MPIKGEQQGYIYKALIDGEWQEVTIQESPLELVERFEQDEEWTKVVRCKDCWYSSVIPKEMQNVGEWHCEYWCAEMHGNDFCSCGKERKRDEDA